jgi:hypothetical protein
VIERRGLTNADPSAQGIDSDDYDPDAVDSRFASATLAKTGFESEERVLIERDIAEAEAEVRRALLDAMSPCIIPGAARGVPVCVPGRRPSPPPAVRPPDTLPTTTPPTRHPAPRTVSRWTCW